MNGKEYTNFKGQTRTLFHFDTPIEVGEAPTFRTDIQKWIDPSNWSDQAIGAFLVCWMLLLGLLVHYLG